MGRFISTGYRGVCPHCGEVVEARYDIHEDEYTVKLHYDPVTIIRCPGSGREVPADHITLERDS